MTTVVCPLCKPRCKDREAIVSDDGTTICEAGSVCTAGTMKFLHTLADDLLNHTCGPAHGSSRQ